MTAALCGLKVVAFLVIVWFRHHWVQMSLH